LVAGFRSAKARFVDADAGSDEKFHALFEVLAWVGAIRDRLHKDKQPIPPVINGMYYARNVVLHQGADVLEWIFVPPAVLGQFVVGFSRLKEDGQQGTWWPERDMMPKPQSPTGTAEYEAHLAGHTPEAVMEAVETALE
jgi:hypothetical protein